MPCTLAPAPLLARIDEAACIGCTLCIAACPVDAIVGAAKLMHTVLVERCTGCELCLPPCPVDCIALVPRSRPWTAADAARARANEAMRNGRLARRGGRVEAPAHMPLETTRAQRQAAVAAALERARARRAARR